jgi:hypothetical protein
MVTKITSSMLGGLRDTENLLNYLNMNLLITKVSFEAGNFGEVAILHVQLPDKSEKRLRTGSKVILKQLHQLHEQHIPLPWLVKVVKVKRYLTFAEPD